MIDPLCSLNMTTPLHTTLLFMFLCIPSAIVAQELDDLFAGSAKTPPCECDHHIFALKGIPEWMPKAAKSALAEAVSMDWNGTDAMLLYCPTTNAVIQLVPLKASCSFLVCPSNWRGFKPRFATEESITERGIPVDKIRAMFQLPDVVMGPLQISVRARHSGDMMGDAEMSRRPQRTNFGEP
ncbi:hypothetical protein-signal peptide and transmembrane prediction [Rhodopirellula baltica SH 1]|uniref:Uncharacterized protein n=2 Tax=Rhodopirellula baltica TaxID=265606 RepID=Q7UUQ4_RHOBA|nr:hypothetical protein-signal peptide and transmembrane prediction [Rhodopirellula baltica SH 1]